MRVKNDLPPDDFSRPLEPPRSTVVKWLRLNLSLTIFIFSLTSGAVGAIISGTMRVAKYEARLQAIEDHQKDIDRRLTKVEDFQSETPLRRIKLAEDLADIRGKITVLDSQETFVANFIRDNLVLQPGHAPLGRTK